MKFIVCLFLIIVSSGADTDFMCPSTEQWKYRGQICTSDDSYVCLWDEVNYNYAEQCDGPKSERKGFKANINRGNLNRAECSADRYQPVLFTTVGNSDCQLRKSFCIDVGQVKVDNGSPTTDVKCICDYTCGYAFLTMPRDPCFCVPSEEDCSCYRKNCSQGEVLSRDYTCTTNSTDNQHQCPLIPVTSCSTELLLNKGPMNLEEHMVRWNYAAAGIAAVLIMLIIIMVIVYWKFQQIRYIVCRKVPFISPLKDLVCIQNEDVTFQCEVSIYIRLKWYKDDKEIDATDPKFVMSSADKCHQLTVTNTQEHDSGVYYIGFKDKRNSAKLDVKVPFISPLKDIICIRDEDATFKCEVSLDNTIVKWYKGDHEIDANDPRFIMLSTGKIHQLTVKQVQDNDKGIYKIGFRDKKYGANLDVRGGYT